MNYCVSFMLVSHSHWVQSDLTEHWLNTVRGHTDKALIPSPSSQFIFMRETPENQNLNIKPKAQNTRIYFSTASHYQFLSRLLTQDHLSTLIHNLMRSERKWWKLILDQLRCILDHILPRYMNKSKPHPGKNITYIHPL